jgi:DUF971 family protein
MHIAPVNLQLIGNEVAIRWSDGAETYFPLEALRRACPCAACGGEPDVMGRVEKREVVLVPASFQLRSWQIVGGYALQPTWDDGHNTGLYSFSYLRSLASQTTP